MERYDRQMRIEGWNQRKLEGKPVVFIGDNYSSFFFDDVLFPLTITSASLGIDNVTVYKPGVSKEYVNFLKKGATKARVLKSLVKDVEKYSLSEFVKELNPFVNYHFVDTYFVNQGETEELLKGAETVVDFSCSSISKKICKNWLEENNKKGVFITPSPYKVKVFTYHKGRENQLLGEVLNCESSLPKPRKIDPVISTIGASIALEDLKDILMDQPMSIDMAEFSLEKIGDRPENWSKLHGAVIGSGALGIPAGALLGLKGMGKITFMDHDTVEETNLNRQPFYWDAVGKYKTEILARRVEEISEFRTKTEAICEPFTEKTKVGDYDIVFDCVDVYKARKIISQACEKEKVPLVSGGTSFRAGNVTSYKPGQSRSIHEVVRYDNLIEAARMEQERNPSCIMAPNPSVIMVNWTMGAVMVSEAMKLLFPYNYGEPMTDGMIIYDAESPNRLGKIKMA